MPSVRNKIARQNTGKPPDWVLFEKIPIGWAMGYLRMGQNASIFTFNA
jgi:hypothetical protein